MVVPPVRVGKSPVVLGELANGACVRLLGARGEAAEVHVGEHATARIGSHEVLLGEVVVKSSPPKYPHAWSCRVSAHHGR
jgi:hypothetical protein